jgi:predicted metal-binding membrane protein
MTNMETSLLQSPAATSPRPAIARPAAARPTTARPATIVFAAIFTIGLAITVYCCRAMGHGLPMPGGWTMSMMWLQMPGQSRLAASAQFLIMWLGMVSVMNLPLMVPVFLHTGRRSLSLCYIVGGYYTIWLIAGIAVCFSGTAMAEWVLHSDQGSRLIPFCRSGVVIAAGLFQCSHSLHPRSHPSPHPHSHCLQPREASFRRGCRQGLACCISCAAPMAAQLALGMMDPVVIAVITIAIAAERRRPRSNLTTPALGIAAICTGAIMIWTFAACPAEHPQPIDCGSTQPAHNTTQATHNPPPPTHYTTQPPQYTVFSASSNPSSPLPATGVSPASQP